MGVGGNERWRGVAGDGTLNCKGACRPTSDYRQDRIKSTMSSLPGTEIRTSKNIRIAVGVLVLYGTVVAGHLLEALKQKKSNLTQQSVVSA